MAKECLNCGKDVPYEKRGDSKFCSTACKNSFNYRNKGKGFNGLPVKPEENNLEQSLRGVIEIKAGEIKSKEESDSIKFKEPLNLEADFLDLNLFDENPKIEEQVGEEIKGEKNSSLPSAFIEKETKMENPLYLSKQRNLKNLEKQKLELEVEFKKLEAQLQYQASRNGKELIWAGGIGGGMLGLSKKDNNILKAIFYAALGAGIGHAGRQLTKGGREKDKEKQITAIQKRMNELSEDYKLVINMIDFNKAILKRIPQYEVKKEKISNPEYQKALSGLKQEGLKNSKVIPDKENIKFKSDKIIQAKDISNMNYKALNFQGLWLTFFGNPSMNFHCLVHGNPGEGKSTFCMWFARYLAENIGRVLYVSGEEGLNMTFKEKLKYCKADVPGFYVLDVRTGDAFLKEVQPDEFHFIILDSLHDMDIDARKMKSIFERFKNTAFITIDQNNKKGELFGTNEMKHIHDMVVNVRNYEAETTKNRFKAKGMVFKTEDFMDNEQPGANHLRIISLRKDEDKPRKFGDDGYTLDSDRRNTV